MRWSAVVAADPVEPWSWSAPVGDGCIGSDGAADPLLRLAALPLATCSRSLEHLQRAAGRRVEFSASFRAPPNAAGGIGLLVTQFHDNAVTLHQFRLAALAADGVATLAVRTYVLPDSDRVVVGVQSVGFAAPVEVRDLASTVSADPLVEGAMSDVARVHLDHALQVIVDHAFALDPAQAPSLLRESRALATGAVTVDDTHDAIRHALARIGDGHSRLLTSTDVTAWTITVPRPPYDIERRTIDARIAYVRVPTFASLDEEERAAYARFLAWTVRQASTGGRPDGLVIDLRSNDGGSFIAMLEGLCGLFDGRRVVGGFDDRAGRRVRSWTCPSGAVPSTEPPIDTKGLPIAVLVGPRTASAGEMVAIALHGRARTVLVGAPTRGLTTGVELVPLGAGAQLALATSVSVDVDGHAYRAGLVPDITTPGDGPSDRPDRSLDQAVAWIDAQATKGAVHGAAPRAMRRQRVPAVPRAAAGISKSG